MWPAIIIDFSFNLSLWRKYLSFVFCFRAWCSVIYRKWSHKFVVDEIRNWCGPTINNIIYRRSINFHLFIQTMMITTARRISSENPFTFSHFLSSEIGRCCYRWWSYTQLNLYMFMELYRNVDSISSLTYIVVSWAVVRMWSSLLLSFQCGQQFACSSDKCSERQFGSNAFSFGFTRRPQPVSCSRQ